MIPPPNLPRKAKIPRKNESGFSLLELVIVCLILTIILGMIAMVVNGIQSSYNQRRTRTEQLNDGSAALDLMTRVIRMAGANTSLQALTPTGSNQLRVRADWNPTDGVLNGQYEDITFLTNNNSLFIKNESTNQLVELTGNVSSLNFQYFNSAGNATSVPDQIAKVTITLQVGTVSPRTFQSTVSIRKGLSIK